MGTGESPLHDRVLFIEGLPRSGTTWLVTLVASHPDIAGGASESHLFDMGVDRLFDNHESPTYGTYLAAYVSSDELTRLARQLCDGVLEAKRERVKPAAEFVVEKTPLFSRRAREIMTRKLRCYPDAWYLHVARDDAAIQRSLRNAPFARAWGREEIRDRTRESRAAIQETLSGHPRYRELYYDDLRANPVDETSAIFDWLGLDAGAEVRRRMLAVSGERVAQFEPPDDDQPALRSGLRARLGRLAAPLRRRQAPPDPASQLIEALRDNEEDKLRAVTSGDLKFELRTGEGDLRAEGSEGRAALMRAGEVVFRSPYVYFGWHPPVPGRVHSFLGQAVTPDTERIDVAFHVTVHRQRVVQVTMISAGDLAGRPMRDLDTTSS